MSRTGLSRWLGCAGALVAIVALCVLLGLPASRAEPKGESQDEPGPVTDVSLRDLQGQGWSLSAACATHRAVVLVFVSTECPMVGNYLPVIADLAKHYKPRNVAFLLVCSNPEESEESLREMLQEAKVTLPLLLDRRQELARSVGATLTPQAVVLDSGRRVLYRGAIDDQYYGRLKPRPVVTRQHVKIALDEYLQGKPISVRETQAYGCEIAKPEKVTNPNPQAAAEVTYYRDVLPILQRHCQECHRPNNVAPFPLMTYRQAVKWGRDIKEFTASRWMPPWRVREPRGFFHNERRLSEQELATLARWVDAGMPEGDPKDAPPPRTWSDDWYLGKPDLVLELPEDMIVGPEGRDLFRCFIFRHNLTEDKFIKAFEVRPSNRRVVHHTLNMIIPKGMADKLEQEERAKPKHPEGYDTGPGYTVAMGFGRGVLPRGGFGGWAPGLLPHYLPPGVAYYLPKDSDILLQVHYHRTGKVERDRLQVALYFAKPEEQITHRLQTLVLPGRFLFIPAGAKNFEVKGEIWLEQEATILSVLPHMHLIGKDIRVTYTVPGDQPKTLLYIDPWDYNWQETYFLKQPLPLPAGTRLEVVAHYDNSADNPNNPNNPPRPVIFGEQTTDEMCFVFFGAISDKPGRIRIRTRPPEQKPNAP
ncbi:MAG: redoxin family protein [Gemmatales bacterium]|nr:redoxin family protein [Gemmatales bacterium]MDW7995869.1 redoxin family protein [Gemmatales bacterium]